MKLRINVALAIGIAAAMSGLVVPAFAQTADLTTQVTDSMTTQDASPSAGDAGILADLPQTAEKLEGGKGECGPGGRECGGKFNLTDDQAEKLYAIRTATREKIGPKMLEMRALKRQIRDLMSQPSIDRNAISQLQGQVIADKTSIETTRAASMLDAAEVFTPEQRHAMHERMIRGGFGGRHHHGGGRGFHGRGGMHGQGGGHGGPGGPGGHGEG